MDLEIELNYLLFWKIHNIHTGGPNTTKNKALALFCA